MQKVAPALLISNGIAFVLLFWLGFACGRSTVQNPWFKGFVMVIVGGAMAALAKAPGG